MKDILCIIPARGGSKGILNKNLRVLGGKPLVAHSICHALLAQIPNENIVLTSDSNDICDIGYQYGISVIQRPDELATDTASTESALLHVLESYTDYKTLLLLQPTSPIRFKGTINNFINFYKQDHEERYLSALVTTKFHNFMWRKTWGGWSSSYAPSDRPMRQFMNDHMYYENGNMYLTDIETFKKKKCRLCGKIGVFVISELEGLQIDTIDEFNHIASIFEGTVLKNCEQ